MGIKLYRFLLGFIGFVELWGPSQTGYTSLYGIRRYGICHPMGCVAYGDSHLMMFVANRVFSF